MELQLTDFENAAFSATIMLLSRVILALELTFYIPISRLDENMNTAQRREAVNKEKFWFRANVLPKEVDPGVGSTATDRSRQFRTNYTWSPQDSCRQMTLAEIFGGSGDFPGLIPLCELYLDFIGCDSVVRNGLQKYMDFVLRRARGELMTPATWMRHFITTHPTYKKDSRVPPEAAYDLLRACDDIGCGRRRCPELHGDLEMPVVIPALNPFVRDAAPPAVVTGLDEKRAVLLEHFRRRAAERQIAEMDRKVAQVAEEAEKKRSELATLREKLERVADSAPRRTPLSPAYAPPPRPTCGAAGTTRSPGSP